MNLHKGIWVSLSVLPWLGRQYQNLYSITSIFMFNIIQTEYTHCRCWSWHTCTIWQEVCSVHVQDFRILLLIPPWCLCYTRFALWRQARSWQTFILFISCHLVDAGVYLHDPTALLAAVNPSLLTYTEGAVRVQTTGIMRGLTIFHNSKQRFEKFIYYAYLYLISMFDGMGIMILLSMFKSSFKLSTSYKIIDFLNFLRLKWDYWRWHSVKVGAKIL